MTVFYKAIRSRIPSEDGNKKWHLSLVKIRETMSTQELGNKIAEKSSLTPGDVHNVIRNLMSVMRDELLDSRSVRLDGLGTFTLTAVTKGNGVDTEEEVGPQQIKTMRCRFTPEYTRTSFTGTTRHLYDGIRFEHISRMAASLERNGDNGDDDGGGDNGGGTPLG